MIDRTEIEKRDYIAAFDGLRAIAIMSIVGHQMMAYRIPGGFLGLNIFLLLSGYFMTASLMDSLMKNGKVPLKSLMRAWKWMALSLCNSGTIKYLRPGE